MTLRGDAKVKGKLARGLNNDIKNLVNSGAQSRGGEREDSPPARPKKVEFALNIKHVLFDAML